MFIGFIDNRLLYYGWTLNNYSLLESLIVSLIVALVAIIGDLFESMVKRYYQVKDSGNIIQDMVVY